MRFFQFRGHYSPDLFRRCAVLLFLCILTISLHGKTPASDTLRQQALAGDVKAMVSLGDEFFQGGKRKRNPVLAAFWYRKAAEKKYPPGCYKYGVCREYGWGVKKDLQEAMKYYSAAGKFAPAQLKKAELLFRGDPGPGWKEGKKIMRQLCRENYYPALLKLANFLYSVPDFRRRYAAEIYQLALRAGNLDAPPPEVLLFHARLLTEGVGTGINLTYARALLEIAAQTGDGESCFRFAEVLEFGRGCPPDGSRAFDFYRKAAAAGHPGGLTRLGDYHLAGTMLPHDPVKARQYFQQGADKDFPAGWRQLGYCWENGIGGAEDKRKAFHCYEQAASRQDPAACYHAGRCFQNGIGVKADPVGAVYFFRRAAALGNREGTEALIRCLEEGRGCAVDLEQARILRNRLR